MHDGVVIAVGARDFHFRLFVYLHQLKEPVRGRAAEFRLTAALVSMLSLETAMLAQFGGNQPEFRRFMTGASGGAVCVFVLGMAVYMIVHASRKLKAESQSFKI